MVLIGARLHFSDDPAGVAPPHHRRRPALLTIAVAIVLQSQLPDQMTSGSRWLLPALETVLLVVLLIANPFRVDRDSSVLRLVGIGITTPITLATCSSRWWPW